MTWGLRDYGTGTWEGGDEGCDHKPELRDGATSGLGNTADKKRAIREGYYGATCGKCGARRVDNQIGLEETPDAYLARMVAVFREVRRVLAPHGTCWVNMGDSYNSRLDGSRGGWNGSAPGPQRTKNDGAEVSISAPGMKPKDLIGMPWRLALALQAPYYTGKIKDERDRIWLAAIVEAEGCMFIHRRKAGQSNGQGYHRKNDNYGPGLEVSSTDRSIVQRCLDIAGVGSICEQTPEANHRRKQTIYRWNVRTLECRDVVRELYPHMVAKQHEARLLLGCPSSGEDARKAWQSLKNLHQGDQPCIDFQPPEGMWERGWFLRSEIIWAKCMPNPMPESVTDRPTKGHEQIFLLTKQARYFYDADAVREPHLYGGARESNGAWAQDEAGRPGPDGKQHLYGNPAGRNLRTVWTIPTQPFKGSHFATFPERLPELCILAGCPERVCSVCGKPSERIVERPVRPDVERSSVRIVPGTVPTRKVGQAYQNWLDKNPPETIGFTDCGHNAWRPGRVLDPFAGSGTTLHVARKHGRHSIGIELNPDYCELAARRLAQQSIFSLGGEL